ncbi:MAG: hypothetical protein C0483_14660 [Pirellula sp.]|nr:hypothetical protein [Pirellula sp.]
MPKQRRDSWDDDDADDRDWRRHDYDADDDDIDEEDDSDDADGDDLLPCPHCGAAIYEQSEKCPKCGEYVDPDAQHRKPLWVVFTLLVLIATFMFYAFM